MNLSISTDEFSKAGIVYLLQLRLDGKDLVKIGVTNRKRVEDRVCEILTAVWKKYRIFPECYVKRYRTADDSFRVEAYLHDSFKEFQYEPIHSFGGSTEFFDIDIVDVVTVYDELIP